MSEFTQPLPYPEDALLTGADSDRRSEIASGLYRHRIASERLAEYHTGDKDTYLSYAEEAALSDAIQDGIKAEKTAERLQAEIETMHEVSPEVTERLLAAFQRAKHGRQAKRKLVESHLRYAAYLARASVGIMTPLPHKAKPSTSDRYKGKNKRPRKIGTYADITKLRSPYAQLEDRMQAAYIGLIKAASSFKPKQATHENQQPSFITYAAWYIQNEIEQSVPYEAPGYRLPINVSIDIRKYEHSKTEVEPDFTSSISTERLEAISQGAHAIPIEELRYEAVPEEIDAYSSDDEHYVGLEELLPDEEDESPFEYSASAMLEAGIDKVLSTTLSEREAGVIRLRFGLVDGEERTLDEVGAVYGITRERVRQIESQTMSKLHHPSHTGVLRDFLDLEAAASSPYWRAEIVRTPREAIRFLGEQALKTTVERSATTERSTEEDDWPALADENEARPTYEVVEVIFTDLLLTANVYNLQQSFARSMDRLYPKGLIDAIEETLGKDLTAGHIEQFWNTHLSTLIEKLQQTIGDDISYDRLGQLFSALLAERMTDDDTITLNIPPNVDGKLGFIGAWLQNGSLQINGNLGDNAAYQAKGIAEITINGNVGDYAGLQTTGYAHVIVMGAAGDMVGHRAGGESSITVHGNAGDFAASCLQGQTTVTIEGNVGEYCACEVRSPYADVQVTGNAGAFLADQAAAGMIAVAGKAETYSPREDFTGQLYIGGQKIQTHKM